MLAHYNIKDLCSLNRDKMEKVFNKIYAEYSYLVFYVAFEIVHRKEDAQDIVNETFLKMYENRHKLQSGRNLKYYLVTIAKNLAINAKKVSARFVSYDDNLDPGTSETSDEFAEYIAKFSEFLTPDEVSLVVYRLLYEYPFKEIARMMTTTTNSVTSKYKRTLDKIRNHYGR